MAKNYYEILGISENDKNLPFDKFKDVLKKKYRDSSKKYHPDLQQGKSDTEKKQAEEKFKDINEAYQVLSDSEKKQRYDMFGTADGGGFQGPGNDDLMNMFRHMHNDLFRGGFGGSPFGQPQVVNGTDCRIKVECTLEDVYNGISKTYKYHRKGKCPDCGGTGSKSHKIGVCPHCNGTGMNQQMFSQGGFTQIIQSPCEHCNGTGKLNTDPCHKCNGTGLIDIDETVTIEIPKNARDGSQMVMRGKGNGAPNGEGTPGNLIVLFRIKKHDIFGVCDNGYDLYCKTNVSVLDCITGCESEIKCLDGTKTKITIPQGTRENDKVIVKGKGMPKSYGNGDMLVYINQVMPKTLSNAEKKVLEELKNSKNFKK